MQLEVLLSCMNKNEFSIIQESNLMNVTTLIINQCSENASKIIDDKHRVINTTSRGLSISRNIGINNAVGDICLLCDDDEILVDNVEKIIIDSYKKISQADIIIFKITNRPKALKPKVKKLTRLELLKVSSVQITFKREAVQGKIKFDSLLGAGTLSGSGEENKFLMECYKAGMKIYYVPIDILTLKEDESTWFIGFDEEYFYRRGFVTRYTYGISFSIIYAIYFLISKRKRYIDNISTLKASFYIFKGIFDNCIEKDKRFDKYNKSYM